MLLISCMPRHLLSNKSALQLALSECDRNFFRQACRSRNQNSYLTYTLQLLRLHGIEYALSFDSIVN